ncbi:autotransporter outer membrane beta-barrel domain-containing protein [Buttiauxella selenatireducens]|uniref:autotransporter outer membrane beta-barrel domain-containing protein n=1 Tax=Buttiauxella selenatireducens TaxID=3073902 RepID=UPI004042565D
MNKIFNVVWNHCLQCFVVTSELARRCGKVKSTSSNDGKKNTRLTSMGTCSRKFLALVVAQLFAIPSYAIEITVEETRPEDASVGRFINGFNVLTGSFGMINSGHMGYELMTLGQARDQGLIVTPEQASYVDLNVFKIGDQTKTVSYIDPITHNTVTVRVYDNGKMTSSSAASIGIAPSIAVGANGQYVDKNLWQVKDGGELTVQVAKETADWTNDTSSRFYAYLKGTTPGATTSSAFLVDGNSTLNYDTKTVVIAGNNASNIKDPTKYVANFTADTFVGSFTSVLGKRNVTNIAEFKQYNSDLIAAVQQGKLTEAQYSAELLKAWDNTPRQIFVDTHISPDDAVNAIVRFDQVAYIHGDGAQAKINISKDSNIEIVNSDISVVRVENGASLVNDGVLGSVSGKVYGSAVIMATGAGTSVINNGVVDVGTNPDMLNYKLPDGSTYTLSNLGGDGLYGLRIFDSSTGVNNGVINLASHGVSTTNMGVFASTGGIFTNNGSLNISTSPDAQNSLAGMYNYGFVVNGNSTVKNSGEIYIGRESQRKTTDITADIAINQPSVGANVSYGHFTNMADGTITIGSLTRNATAISTQGVNPHSLNQGTINVNGNTSGGAVNIGMLAQSAATDVVNAGTINLNGVNAYGMKITTNSAAENSGTININGGRDPVSNEANYGMFIDGATARGKFSGQINLNGAGTIGVHARNKGALTIADDASMTFAGGNKQIGYFVSGAGTKITSTDRGSVDIATDDSMLFRIEDGATFARTTPVQAMITASGKNSVVMQVTGKGSDVHATGLGFTAAGEDSTGIKIEGGASGTLESDVTIKLQGKGATAGIVDGNYYDLNGALVANKKGNSILTSYAELLGSSGEMAEGAYGYKVLNGGKLTHEGTIDFKSDDSTGVLVNGGTLENRRNITVNGTGVHVTGTASTVTNTATATVNATDGKAAYVVDGGASLALTGAGTTTASGTAHGILLDTGAAGLTVTDATINMSATGTGSGIENKAGVSGIALTNTTITVDQGIGVHTAASMAAKNSGTITVNGGGTGIQFEKMGGGTTSQAMDMSGSQGLVINVNSSNGKGLVTDSSADLKTGVSVNVNNAAGGSALIVNGTTKNIEQSGVLTSQSTTSSVVGIDNGAVTTFNNSGTIKAATKDQKAVETLTGAGVTFTNLKDAVIQGHVNLMAGNNTINLEAGSKGTDFTTGSGDDVFNLNHLKSAVTGVFDTLTGGTGSDALNMVDSSYVLTDVAALKQFEKINLSEKADLTLQDTLLPLGDAQDDAAGTGFAIAADSALRLLNGNNVDFNSHLSGSGLLQVQLAPEGDKAFNFTANNAADKFAGTVALADATFELAGLNTTALSDATLRLDNGSTTHVGDGEQTISGLKFNGGKLEFDSGTPGETVAKGSVHTTESMDLSGSGVVQVAKGSVSNDHPLAPTLLDLLAQDDATTMVQLAVSDTTTIGSGGALVLKDQDGNVISDGITADIAQNGNTVAKGTYDYRLTSGDAADGLYISYGLTQVDLLTAGADALALNAAGLSGNAADLSAKITGTGDLAIDTGAGNTVSLSNTLNDYVGNTDIRSGTLKMIADNVLGQTDVLSLAADTALDMNGKAQTVGSLQSTAGSTVNLNGGALSLSHGGVSDGALTGAGELNVLADTLTVNGANTGLSATTTVANGATVALNDAAGLGVGDIVNAGKVVFSNAVGTVENSIRDGVAAATRALTETAGSVDLVNSQLTLDGDNSGFSGVFNIDAASQLTATAAQQLGTADIADEGELVLNAADNWALTNNLSGAGNLTKQGAGVVTLSGNAAYTGLTDIQAGGLMLGSEAAPITLASSQVNVAKDTFLAGYGGVAGNVDNLGTLYVGAQNESGGVQTFTVGQDLVNNGTVNIGHGSVAGNVLNVNGNYTGNDGLINFNTVLGDDNSVTDKMVVAGNTAGTTNVSVTNAGGTGAQTLNGIELISVGGASDGEFKQAGRIVAGAYDYALVRGEGSNNANWYLTNAVDGSVPVEPTDPGIPVDPTAPVDPSNPTDPAAPSAPEQIIRPEAGAYTANLAAANTMFLNRLHDRLGETQYTDALTGEEKVTSMWMRNVGGHTNSRDNSGQLKTQSNRYVLQMGGDVAQWSTDGLNRLHLGVMAGYGNSHSNTRSHATGYSADGSVDGYSTGVYATWYDNDAEKNGLYVDTWAQYSWFNNHVSGEKLATESYKSKGVTASVETGYTFNMGEFKGSKGTTNTWYIQPQAQAIWMGVEADDHREANGTKVQGSDGNVQTRLGARAYLKSHDASDNGKDREFQPFVEANWIHNTSNFSSTLDGVSSSQAGTRNIGEVKVGVEGQLNKNLNMWGNVGVQVGDKGYNDSAAMIGVKYSFK